MIEAVTSANRSDMPEPWLRGTLRETPAVLRGVLHALALAEEDALYWCGGLTGVEVNARPYGLPSIAFHLRHIAGSLDRLLTYAEGRALSEQQLACLAKEGDGAAAPHVLLRELSKAIANASERVLACTGANLDTERVVGRSRLPTTLGGLLVHIADHTQRHVGQLVTTAQLVIASRNAATSPESQ